VKYPPLKRPPWDCAPDFSWPRQPSSCFWLLTSNLSVCLLPSSQLCPVYFAVWLSCSFSQEQHSTFSHLWEQSWRLASLSQTLYSSSVSLSKLDTRMRISSRPPGQVLQVACARF